MSTYLTKLNGMNFTPKHLFWLDEMCKLDYDKEKLEELLKLASKGKLQFWGFKGDKGLFVTHIVSVKGNNVLVVYGLAGNGIFQVAKKIINELEVYAKEWNCKRIEGHSQIQGHAKIFLAIGMSPVSTRFVKEI